MFLRVLMISFCLQAPAAFAHVMFEPVVGYSMGTLTYKTTAGEEGKAAIDGMAFGGRLGLTFSRLFIAGEYQAVNGTRKMANEAVSYPWNTSTPYVILGVGLSPYFRLYGGVALNHTSLQKSQPEVKYTGGGYKAGLSISGGRQLAINVDYNIFDIKNVDSGGVKLPITSGYSSFKYSSIVVSMSFPFYFF